MLGKIPGMMTVYSCSPRQVPCQASQSDGTSADPVSEVIRHIQTQKKEEEEKQGILQVLPLRHFVYLECSQYPQDKSEWLGLSRRSDGLTANHVPQARNLSGEFERHILLEALVFLLWRWQDQFHWATRLLEGWAERQRRGFEGNQQLPMSAEHSLGGPWISGLASWSGLSRI